MDVYQESELLQKIPVFSKLESSKLKLLAFTSEALTYSDGQILFKQNDSADSAYVIMEGEVEILGDRDGGEMVPLLTRGKNELIGEMAALSNAPRTATIRAKGRVRVLKIPNEQFVKTLCENPEVALGVMRELSDKLAKSHQQVELLQAELTRLSRHD